MTGPARYSPITVGGRGPADVLNLITHILCVVVLLVVLCGWFVIKAGYDRAIAELQRRDAALEKRVEALEAGYPPAATEGR